MVDSTTMLMIIPLLLIQLGLVIYNLINISKKEKTKYLNKVVWIFIILLGSLLGNLCYLIIEGVNNDSD